MKKNGRVFKIGDRLIEIHGDVLDKLLLWNAVERRQDQNLDFAFGLSILLSLVPAERIEAEEMSSDIVDFVFG